ncbi:LytTR family DNA-binding domain-containing protein [Spirosoma sp. RP8]|uniref:LytTR family DNA-binding domain-containing protein n=1 Tax=Spirosoma liriopis TaxID=2937440 RepID=A0ABT0HHH9_9BACT|nr:LytTR family DNA-binding domain-containing protein [Spirosoma liriopis]MCK8491626.1 LytTR family DNA-binding domain-containing protein [Spirosoma liriopis]
MIRAIAVDDEPPALRVLTNFCGRVDFIDLQKTFVRPDEALAYLTNNPVDLLFLDINMPALSGLDFHKLLPKPTLVIFTTAYAEYAVEGFTLNAVDYLLKPFTFERFEQSAQKARDAYQFRQLQEQDKPVYLYVRADYRLYQIPLSDILFIEGLDDYLKIYRKQDKPIVCRMTMKAMMEQLAGLNTSSERFIRVHRSYIVPLNRIEAVQNKTILLAEREIPIGASYEADFFRQFGV